MTAATLPAVAEPGIYDIPEDLYHADPVPGGSLSSSGARKLLPPSCPAIFRYEQDHRPESTDAFDFGTAAHKLVLGAGAEIAALDFRDWRTKASQEAAAEVRERGAVPLLRADHDRVTAMASAVRAHPLASALLNPACGRPEQSLFWQDPEFGVWLRARLDWLPDAPGGRMIVSDYKTSRSAEPRSFAKSAADFGYHCQAAFYIDGIRELLGTDAAFVFIVQSKTPPYLVTVVELDPLALRTGRELNRRAIEIFRDCQESGLWPAYSDDIEQVSLPPWALAQARAYLEAS